MAAPEIKVKFGTDGADQVTSAFRKVGGEAKSLKTAASGVSSAFSGLQGILGGLSIAGLVAGFTSLVKKAIDTADALGDMAAATGSSVKTLSVLDFMFKQSGNSTDLLEKGLKKLAPALDALDAGDKKVTDGFRRLGLAAKDLRGLDTASAWVKVGRAFAEVEGSSAKATIAQQLFGKSGMDTIEVMDMLANDGFEKAKRRAEELGIVLDDDLVNSAGNLKKIMAELEAASIGVAYQFLRGFAPAIQDAFATVGDAFGGGQKGMKAFGEYVGLAIGSIIRMFMTLGQTVALVISSFETLANSKIFHSMTGLLGLWMNKGMPKDEGSTTAAKMAAIWDNYKKQFGETWTYKLGDPFIPPKPGKALGSAAGAGGGKDAEKAMAAVGKAELELQKALLDNETKLLKANLAIREEETKNAYEDGLLTLQEYYEKRRNFINAEAGKELKALQSEYDAIAEMQPKTQAEQIRQAAELAKIDGKKAELMAKTQLTNYKLGREELEKTRKLKADMLEIDAEQAAMEGNFALARQKRNEAELEAYRQKLVAAKMTPEQVDAGVKAKSEDQVNQGEKELLQVQMDLMTQYNEITGNTYANEIEAIEKSIDAYRKKYQEIRSVAELEAEITKLRDVATASAGYDRSRNEFQLAMGQMELGRERELANTSGLVYNNEQRALAVQQQMIPTLQAIADLMMQQALDTGNKTKLLEAQNAQLQVQRLQSSVTNANNAFSGLNQGLFDAAQNSLVSFFESGISGAESLAGAFRSLATSVLSSIQQMIGKMLAMYLMQKMLGMIGMFGGGDASWASPTKYVRAASGGYVRGPGTGTSDSIPAWLSNGEYIVNASAVRQPGVLPLLRSINEGLTVRTPRFSGVAHFAEGGLVGSPGGGAPSTGRLDIGLDDGLLVKFFESPKGSKVLVRCLGTNRRAVKGVIG